MSFTTNVLVVLLLVIGSAFFAISEISLAASRKTRLQQMADEDVHGAKLAISLKENPGKFFSVIQIGINMVAILGGILGEGAFSPYFSAIYENFMPAQRAATAGFLTSVILVTLAFIFFADLIPKRLAVVYPEKIITKCAGPMALLITILNPIVWVLEKTSNAVMLFLGFKPDHKDKLTSDDILATVDAGTNAGLLMPEEQHAIENVFNLENNNVTAAMTARESIIALDIKSTQEEINGCIGNTHVNRFLIVDNSLDKVVGYVESGDILRRVMSGKAVSFTEQGLVQNVQMIPDSLSLSELLDFFSRTHSDFAVVLNEYALVVGVVTLSDVMRAVMGDLVDPDETQIVQRDENSWLVDGATPIVDMLHTLEIDDMPDSSTYETMAGFMMYMMRRIPKRTDKIDWNGFRFEVMNVEQNRIDQILVTRITK